MWSRSLALLGFMVALMTSTAKAQYGCGAELYVNYTHFEACHEFVGGDQDIEKERRDIDFSECLDLWPELSKGDQ